MNLYKIKSYTWRFTFGMNWFIIPFTKIVIFRKKSAEGWFDVWYNLVKSNYKNFIGRKQKESLFENFSKIMLRLHSPIGYHILNRKEFVGNVKILKELTPEQFTQAITYKRKIKFKIWHSLIIILIIAILGFLFNDQLINLYQ